MSWPQPTAQYGQTDRVTFAPEVRGFSAFVRSVIASRPVPSPPSSSWMRTGQRRSVSKVSYGLRTGHLQSNVCSSHEHVARASPARLRNVGMRRAGANSMHRMCLLTLLLSVPLLLNADGQAVGTRMR